MGKGSRGVEARKELVPARRGPATGQHEEGPPGGCPPPQGHHRHVHHLSPTEFLTTTAKKDPASS